MDIRRSYSIPPSIGHLACTETSGQPLLNAENEPLCCERLCSLIGHIHWKAWKVLQASKRFAACIVYTLLVHLQSWVRLGGNIRYSKYTRERLETTATLRMCWAFFGGPSFFSSSNTGDSKQFSLQQIQGWINSPSNLCRFAQIRLSY